jgi:site-specific recombinase XerD
MEIHHMTTDIVVSTPARMTRANSDETLVTSWLRLKDSPATQETYRTAIDQFMSWYRWQSLQTLAVDELSDYKEHLASTGVSKSTQALKLNAVKSLLTYGHKVGYLPFDVGRAVKSAKVPNTLAERILPEWQVMQLVNSRELRERDRLLIRLLYASGGRVSQIINLKWKDVQPNGASGQITVTGKGDKTRAIRLSKEIYFALQVYRPDHAEPVDYVFQSQRIKGQEHRSRQLDRTAVLRIVKNAGKLTGIVNLSPHWFRHAHASHALDKGATVAVVKETLGHASIATTSKYLHAKPEESSALYLAV